MPFQGNVAEPGCADATKGARLRNMHVLSAANPHTDNTSHTQAHIKSAAGFEPQLQRLYDESGAEYSGADFLLV